MKTVLVVVAVLLVAVTLLLPILRRLRPTQDFAGFTARLKAWWMMAISFVLIQRINPSLSLAAFAGLSGLSLREVLHRVDELPRSLRFLCYLTIPVQYYFVWDGWYGMFVVFIPVYIFLYLPTRLTVEADSIRRAATLHWGLMTTVFCVSHAAYLLKFPGGPGLLLFVMLLTEWGEALRLLFPPRGVRDGLVVATSVAAAWLLGGLTPLSEFHALLAGFVLGVAGEVGDRRMQALRLALRLGEGPLKPGQGGGLLRILTLSFTAPLFLHGYRYFYQT